MFELVRMLTKANALLLMTNAFVFVYAGEYFLYNTTRNHYYMSQFGININKTNSLRLEIRAQYDQLLRLLDKPVTDSSAVFLEIVFNHDYIGVRENCETCAIKARKSVKTFDEKNSRRFWVTWDASGVTRIGFGYYINEDEQLVFQPSTSFTVQFITLRSFYSIGYCTVVKDDPPLVSQPSPLVLTTVNVNETLPTASKIISVVVTDPENDTVSVTSGGSRHFQMSNFTLILSKKLDYEQETAHNVTLCFRDDWNEVNVTMLVRVIDEIDEPPLLNMVQNLVIPEELPIGTVLSLLVNVTDTDQNDIFTYHISGNDSSMISIDPSNGTVSIAERIDRDGVSGHVNLGPITVRVIDSAGLENEKALNITVTDINDNPPTCHPRIVNVSVFENGSNETVVLEMNCTDLDDVVSANLSYSVNSTNILQDLLFFNETILMVDTTSLDLETISEVNYHFFIMVIDSLNSSHVHTTSIPVNMMIVGKNEFTPVFQHVQANSSLRDVSIWDITEVNQTISSVLAYDRDVGEDGEIVYSISKMSACDSANDTADNNIFLIDQITGDIRLTKTVNNMSECFQLEIDASDMGNPPQNQTVSLKILIRESRAYQPLIEKDFYSLNIDCDQTNGSLLTSINVSNFQPFNLTYYAIRQNAEEDYISIDSETGNVFLISKPNLDQLYRSVAEVQVFNIRNVRLSASVFLVSTFEPCVSSDRTSTPRSPSSTIEGSSGPSSYSMDDFLDDLKVFGLKALCGLEAFVLACIGIAYLVKKYPCRNREVHPSKPTVKIDTVSQGTSQSQLSSNMSVSNTSTVTTRCSSIESLRLV